MRRGVEAAAFDAAAIVDRLAAEQDGELFERDIVARIHKAVAPRRTRDVAAVEGGDRQACKRPYDVLAEFVLANILVKHPQKMADPRAAAVVQAFCCQARVDVAR